MIKSRKILIALHLLFYLSCTQHKNKINKPVAIYKLSPYEYTFGPFPEYGEFDSTFIGTYIVYNLDLDSISMDSVRQRLTLFADSVIHRHPQFDAFQLAFYQKSDDLDTTYVNGGTAKPSLIFHGRDANDDLSYHEADLLGTYYYSASSGDWEH